MKPSTVATQPEPTPPLNRKRWLTAIQGLRAISFIAVFLTHSGLGTFRFLGSWGVSMFLVLSGFLMAYQYLQKDADPEFGIEFAFGKVRRLYSLHLATMGAFLPLALHSVVKGTLSISFFVASTLLSIGMVQTWVPCEAIYTTLNAPSWFMCAIALSYFLFPLLLRKLRNLNDMRSALLLGLPFLLGHIAACLVGAFLDGTGTDVSLVKWVVYFFSPVRFCDFAIGCVLGWFFIRGERDEKCAPVCRQVIMQLLCAGLISMSFVIDFFGVGVMGSIPVRYALLYLPTTCLLIWLVASSSGVVKRFWSVGALAWIADLSPYAFLIHYPVLTYGHIIANKVLPSEPVPLVVGVAFVLTLALSACWKKLARKPALRK